MVTKKQEMAARRIVQMAQHQARQREVKQKRRLVGRCFKYRNGYSSGDRWWLYAVVTGVDEDGRITVSQFQHTPLNVVSIEADQYGGLLPGGGWQEIPVAEFKAAAVETSNAFLSRALSAMSVAAVDPCADCTGKPSTREKGV